jgi:hypothetical protein
MEDPDTLRKDIAQSNRDDRIIEDKAFEVVSTKYGQRGGRGDPNRSRTCG